MVKLNRKGTLYVKIRKKNKNHYEGSSKSKCNWWIEIFFLIKHAYTRLFRCIEKYCETSFGAYRIVLCKLTIQSTSLCQRCKFETNKNYGDIVSINWMIFFQITINIQLPRRFLCEGYNVCECVAYCKISSASNRLHCWYSER